MKVCRTCNDTEANGAQFFRVIAGIKVPTSRCQRCLAGERPEREKQEETDGQQTAV